MIPKAAALRRIHVSVYALSGLAAATTGLAVSKAMHGHFWMTAVDGAGAIFAGHFAHKVHHIHDKPEPAPRSYDYRIVPIGNHTRQANELE